MKFWRNRKPFRLAVRNKRESQMKEKIGRERNDQTMALKTDRPRSALSIEADLLPGDHIYVKRKGRFYYHHGIYIGGNKVIHTAGSLREKVDPEVRETGLFRFLKGGTPRRLGYEKRLPASETIRIAKEQLSNKSYSMIWNNCEHFATFCATGKKKSRQTKRGLTGLGIVVAGLGLFVLTLVGSSLVRKS